MHPLKFFKLFEVAVVKPPQIHSLSLKIVQATPFPYVLVPIIFTSFAFSAAANIPPHLLYPWSTRDYKLYISRTRHLVKCIFGLFLETICQASLLRTSSAEPNASDYPSGIVAYINDDSASQSSV